MGIGWQISLCFDYGLLYLLLLRSHETSKSWGIHGLGAIFVQLITYSPYKNKKKRPEGCSYGKRYWYD